MRKLASPQDIRTEAGQPAGAVCINLTLCFLQVETCVLYGAVILESHSDCFIQRHHVLLLGCCQRWRGEEQNHEYKHSGHPSHLLASGLARTIPELMSA